VAHALLGAKLPDSTWVPKQANIRVMNALREAGLDIEIIRHESEARTAEQAAALIGCDLAQIAKSLVFSADGELVMVLASGANRVDTNKLAALLGQPIRMANAEAVKAATGYAIGGVAPVGHPSPLPIYIDEDLLKYETIYPAAGTPNTAFAIGSRDLQRISGAIVADIKESR
jgi:Cys-tRNA(Pro) deacylase